MFLNTKNIAPIFTDRSTNTTKYFIPICPSWAFAFFDTFGAKEIDQK
jgi:hypothetical protein